MTIRYRRDIPALMKELGLPMIGAEIGVAEGYFSNDLLEQGLEKLYSVDAWMTLNVKGDGASSQVWHDKNYQAAIDRLAKHGNKSIILRGISEAMSIRVADDHLGLLYLDAGHSYEDVFKDLTVWYPKVVNGGIISGHDYENRSYGVKQAVQDFTHGRFKVYTIPENKAEDAGFIFINK